MTMNEPIDAQSTVPPQTADKWADDLAGNWAERAGLHFTMPLPAQDGFGLKMSGQESPTQMQRRNLICLGWGARNLLAGGSMSAGHWKSIAANLI